jgi:hypothetical protein
MRTTHIRALSTAALAILTLAGGAAAQTTAPAVLSSLEVQQLVKRAEPADHARLAAHFAALSEGGAGAPAPSDEQLTALAGKASTPADHGALEEYFRTAAKRYTTEANEHVAMAQAYRGTRIASAAAHCDRLASLSRDEAKEATAAAEVHKQLAGAAR